MKFSEKFSDEQFAALAFEQDMIALRLRLRNAQIILGDAFSLRDGVVRLADLLISQPSVSRDEFRDAFKEYF